MKKLLTLAQGFGFGVCLGAVALLGLGPHTGAAVAVGGFVVGVGALITSYQGGDALSERA